MLSLYSTRLLRDLLCRTLIGREPLDAEGGPQPGAATQAAHGPPAEINYRSSADTSADPAD
jgi:hypothetical protein